MASGQARAAVHRDRARPHRSSAEQFANLMIDGAVLRIAMRGEPQRVRTRNIVAAKVADRRVRAYLQLLRSSRQRRVEQHSAPPAFIAARKEFRQLPQL